MRGAMFRSPNLKNEGEVPETDPFIKSLMLAVYKSGYKQGAIDQFKGEINVLPDDTGYYIRVAGEAIDLNGDNGVDCRE